MARYDRGNRRYGGDYRDAGPAGGGFGDGGSYYGAEGGGGYYGGAGDRYGGYEPRRARDVTPRRYPGYRGPGTDLGEDIRRGYVGPGPYRRYAVGPGSHGYHEYDLAGGYGRARDRDERGRGRSVGGSGGRRYDRGDYGGRSRRGG